MKPDTFNVMPNNPIEVSGTPMVVPPGLVVHPTVRARWTLDADTVGALNVGESVDADVRIEYSPEAGRYELRALTLSSIAGAGPEITGALLRTVRVQRLLQTTALQSLALVDHLASSQAPLSPELADTPVPAEHLLAHVAVIYRAAEIASDNPGQAVAEQLGMQRRTAANWIARSRAAGYFDRIISEEAVFDIARAWFLARATQLEEAGHGDD